MNRIWIFALLITSVMVLTKNPELLLPTMMEGSKKAITLCVNLCAVYCIWMGLMQIMADCGINKFLAKILRPINKKLFGNLDDVTMELISINLSANVLGLGGAATPAGIKAMERMDNKSGKATTAMIMFVVINATSIQLLPTTVIGLRVTNGSSTPSDIILPSLIATAVSTIIGILLVKIFSKIKRPQKI